MTVAMAFAMVVAMAFMAPALHLALRYNCIPAPNYWRAVLLLLIAFPAAFAAGALISRVWGRWRFWGYVLALLALLSALQILTYCLPWAWAAAGLGQSQYHADDMAGLVLAFGGTIGWMAAEGRRRGPNRRGLNRTCRTPAQQTLPAPQDSSPSPDYAGQVLAGRIVPIGFGRAML